MITVRLPSMLRRPGVPAELTLTQRLASIAELVAALDARLPGLASSLDDTLYNFAVNDALILHGERRHALEDGDVVEIIPTVAGG